MSKEYEKRYYVAAVEVLGPDHRTYYGVWDTVYKSICSVWASRDAAQKDVEKRENARRPV